MKKFYNLFYFVCFFIFQNYISQEHRLYDDINGKIITDPVLIKKIEENKKKEIESYNKYSRIAVDQKAVEMCSNGGFEQYENISGKTVLKNFLYTIGNQLGPTQCRAISNVADSNINIFDPNNTQTMASTVPANYIDKYLGDIKAFDQYALKINYENSNTFSSSVQAKRYKTNNENFVKFNYKAVLQTVYDSSHTDNQPFFKARVLNKNRELVSEFCMIGDEKNCIFSKVPDGNSSYVTLYTANWQSGMLDISAIPNNEEFTIEFIASRCGLNGHFGYAYIDDICTLHSNENIQGTVELDPLNKICPTLPISVCGSYTIPNSGGITATVKKITLNVFDSDNKIVYTTSSTSSHDTQNKKFCFNLDNQNIPNTINANYNVGVKVEYDITGSSCSGTNFGSAVDNDANPGWDISFLNCSSTCDINLQTAKLSVCDVNYDGSEDFNLTDLEPKLVPSTTGYSFSYFKTYNDAVANINSISNYQKYNSTTSTIYVRVSKNSTCFKVIHAILEVKNPTANISGILNVCSGSTVLTASSGASYKWSPGGETTQSITVNSIGTYSVTVTDSYGCVSTATVNIEASQVAVLPTVEITQPSCNSSSGSIKVTSPASEYSYDDGSTWVKNNTLNNVYPGTYKIKTKTINGCISYSQIVSIVAPASTYPNYTSTNPQYCGDTGSITITTPSAYFSFDGGKTWGNSNFAGQLAPGIYKIKTKDINGCESYVNNVYIYGVSLGYPSHTLVQPACNALGSITIEDKSDFYTFDGGTTWVTSNVLNNVKPGNYSIGFKNNLGCTSSYSNLYVYDFKDTNPSSSVIQPSCGIDGSIFISTPGSEFSFDGGKTWSSSNQKNNLPPGTYQIQVKDINGCLSSISNVYLYVPRLDSPVISTIQPTCGNNGTIIINSISDFYSFDNGVTWTTVNKKNLPPGNYLVKIKNKLGCESYSSYIYLNNPEIPLTDYTVINPTCDTKGSITINTVADFYSFDGGYTWGTSNTLTNISTGSYTLKIKNSQGCVSQNIYLYLNEPKLDNPEFDVVSPSCGNIGSITIKTVSDYYSIDGGQTWSTNPVFSSLKEGYYYIMIKNNKNCKSDYQNIYINSNKLYKPKITVTQPACGSNGSIVINTVADQYSIDNGSTWSNSNTFNNLAQGYYYAVIKDKNGCISDYNAVEVKTFYLSNPKFTFTHPTCDTGGTITITSTADYYSIDNGYTWSTNNVFTNLKTGSYYIRIKNSQGCVSRDYSTNVYLEPYYLPTPDYYFNQPTCETLGSITIATVADQYSFDGGKTWSTNPVLSGLTSGYYYILIKNSKGCISNPSVIGININKYYLPNPVIKTVEQSCGQDASISILTPASEYSFDGGKTWTTNPILSKAKASQSYSIVIKNSLGCTSYPYNVWINQKNIPSPSISSIQPTCAKPYGTIYINSYADQYSYDNGKTWSTDQMRTNLSSGYYYIMTKNSLGCVSNYQYVYISSPPTVPSAPIVTVKQPSSCGTTDGSIVVNTTASSYSFDNGASWTTSNTKLNTGAGTYIIKTKQYSYSCESLSTIVNLTSGTTIAAPNVQVTQPTCSIATGSINITSVGDSYSFDNGLSFIYTNSKTDLPPGKYYIKYRNSLGCVSEAAEVTINKASDLPAPEYNVIQPDCTVKTGSISFKTKAALYSFDKGITFNTTDSLNNLLPGTYDLMIKDHAGCISLVSSVTINPAPIIPESPLFSVTNPSGCSSNIGTIKISTVADEYSFDGGKTWINSAVANLPSGTYYIMARNINGCSSKQSIAVIDVPPNAPSSPMVTVVQPISCSNPYGQISITSIASEYSFDNGKTYSSTTTAHNLVPGEYFLRVKNNIGCESPSIKVVINKPTDYPPTPIVIVQQIDCLHTSASITITNSGSEFSIDNGKNWYQNNIFNGLLPGKYNVLIKNKIGCISEVTEVDIPAFVNPTPKPTANNLQNFCVQNNAKISDLVISGSNIRWYTADVAGNAISNNTLLIDGQTYYASQTIGNCEGERVAIKVNIITTSSPFANQNQEFCISEKATLNKILITGNNIKWYDSAIGGNLLPNTTLLTDGATYYASQTENSCESIHRTPVKIKLVVTNIIANDFSDNLCDQSNDSKETINLKDYESKIISNPSLYNFVYYNAQMQKITNPTNFNISIGNNVIYVSINTSQGCDKMVTLSITLNPIPDVNLPKQIEYCNENPITLDAGTGFSNYLWKYNNKFYSNQQTIKPTQIGQYTLTVVNAFNCSVTTDIMVISPIIPIIQSIAITNSSATIKMAVSGNYEFSLDQKNWQSSDTFYNLKNGMYNVYVRVRGKICSITSSQFTIFDIPNAFTPNGDGENEYWKIEGIEVYKGSHIRVLDKFGNVVLDKIITGPFEWNGKYNGRNLPTATYYYIIKLSDGRLLTGYLLIKNRN